jgi:hypothetical protein
MERFESASPVEDKNSMAKLNAADWLKPFSDKLSNEVKVESTTTSEPSGQGAQVRVGENFDYAKSASPPEFLYRTSPLDNLDKDRLNFADLPSNTKPIQAGLGAELLLLGTVVGGYAIMSGKIDGSKLLTKTFTAGGQLAYRNPRTAVALAIGTYLYTQFAPSDKE